MNDLVERLQNLIEVSEVDCERDLYRECADRIEALEDWQSKQRQDIIKLGAMVGRLEKVLGEIVRLTDEDSHYLVADVARAALKEGE